MKDEGDAGGSGFFRSSGGSEEVEDRWYPVDVSVGGSISRESIEFLMFNRCVWCYCTKQRRSVGRPRRATTL